MDFLGLVLMALIYFFIVGAHSLNRYDNDRKYAKCKEFTKEISDRNMVYKKYIYPMSTSKETEKEYVYRAAEDLKEIFGDNWEEMYERQSTRCWIPFAQGLSDGSSVYRKWMNSIADAAFYILAAKECGKAVECGPSGCLPRIHTIIPYTYEESKEIFFRLYHRISVYLKQHHPEMGDNLDLMYNPYDAKRDDLFPINVSFRFGLRAQSTDICWKVI